MSSVPTENKARPSYFSYVKEYGDKAIDAYGTDVSQEAVGYGIDRSEEKSQWGVGEFAKGVVNEVIKQKADEINAVTKEVFDNAVDQSEQSSSSYNYSCTLI